MLCFIASDQHGFLHRFLPFWKMDPDRRRLPVLALLLALAVCPGYSSSPHSLHYFYIGLSQPGQGLPQFIIVGYVDDQPIVKYDDAKVVVPQVPWMEKAGKDDPQYWERETQSFRNAESVFRVNLETLRGRYNQSRGGLHTLQWMYGCDVGSDGRPREGYHQYAYDGEDFLSFDKETLTWTACVPQAKISKDKWDMQLDISHYHKDYLEGTCVEWLQRYLDYGNEILQRTEKPTVKVTLKKRYHDSQETLFCQIYGFYPKEIEVTWMKDGVDQISETFTGGVVPNSDGTYHTWLSIDVDPKERGLYRCNVKHDSLSEPLEKAWERPVSNIRRILVIPVMMLLIVLILVCFIIFLRIRREKKNKKVWIGTSNDYEKAPKKKQIEDSYPPTPVEKPTVDFYIPPSDCFLTVRSTCSRDSGHSSEGSNSEESCESSGSFSSDNSDPGLGSAKPLLESEKI